jgi:phosphoglycolate phosphatase-like HAD superfamily hydrolase
MGPAAGLPPGAHLTPAAAAPFHPDTVVLDVDGVLVDVTGSFRESVRHTVTAVQQQMGVPRPWTPTLADVAALKRAGGFNDDIHSSIALAAIGAAGSGAALGELLAAVEAAGGGLTGLRAAAPELPRVDGSLCLRVFDEHYWRVSRLHETALVGADLPRRLRESAAVRSVALITGRTPAELEAALGLLGWPSDELDAVVTGDRVRKPDPACLDLVLAACGSRAALYVGDVRDDWELVRRHRAERPGAVEVRGVIVGAEAEELRRRFEVDVTLRDAGDLCALLRWWAATTA